jgi:ABC-type Fe3+-hydroxamate transport system substrate-binding protein
MPFVTLPSRAYNKIISIVPSQTELLYSLGLDKEVIGITKFCIHPEEWFKTKTRVGGTKKLNIELIRKLQPDLIIANKEENVKEQVETLSDEFDVYLSDINNLEDSLKMIADVGALVNKQEEAKEIIEHIKEGFSSLKHPQREIKTCYLIWKDPYMTIGSDTFINDMMKRCGLKNIFSDKKRYPEVTLQDIKDSGCELVLLSSEPYPFKEKHIKELEESLPGMKILLADGEMFSWYGSRLMAAAEYFKKLQGVFC